MYCTRVTLERGHPCACVRALSRLHLHHSNPRQSITALTAPHHTPHTVGKLQTTSKVVVSVTDVPEPPSLSLPSSSLTISEDSARGYNISVRFQGSDPDADDAGKLQYSMVPNYETDPDTCPFMIRSTLRCFTQFFLCFVFVHSIERLPTLTRPALHDDTPHAHTRTGARARALRACSTHTHHPLPTSAVILCDNCKVVARLIFII